MVDRADERVAGRADAVRPGLEDVGAQGVAPQDLHHRGRDPVGLARREGLVGGLQEHSLGEDVEQQRVLGTGQVR